jgi:transposase-like protein
MTDVTYRAIINNWVMKNLYIFGMVTSANMKQFENSMAIHEVYIEMFDMRSISYSANVNTIF